MRKKHRLFISLILGGLILAGCTLFSAPGEPAGPAIQAAAMVKDPAGTGGVEVFKPDDTFYCVVNLAAANDDATVRAVWKTGVAENEDILGQTELPAAGHERLLFKLVSRSGRWPAGAYQVELYLNDELVQTVDFQVETDEIAVATPTATPGPPPPTPTQTPTPTRALAEDSKSHLVGRKSEEIEFEALPFYEQPYLHLSEAFSFLIPRGWEIVDEDESRVTVSDGQSYLGGLLHNAQAQYDEDKMAEIIEQYVAFIAGQFAGAEAYEILEDGTGALPGEQLHYVALRYRSPDGGGDIDLIFEQRETVVFILYFATPAYKELQPTWSAIKESYKFDEIGAAETLEGLAFAALWPKPSPTPLPPTTTNLGFNVPPGKALFVVYNYTGKDWNINIGPHLFQAAANRSTQGYQISTFVLDPGSYKWHAQAVGTDWEIRNPDGTKEFEFTVGVGAVQTLNVR